MLAFGLVGAIHVGIIYVIISALVNHGSLIVPKSFHVTDVIPEPPKQAKQPDIRETFIKPDPVTVPIPDIPISDGTPDTGPKWVRNDPVKPLLPSIPKAVTALEGVGATHTIPPYPMAAIRGEMQGTVTLRLEIGTDGTVQNATVAESSGSAVLDDSALVWVKQHWRYRPATEDGKAIPSTTLAAVTFNLKNARR
jgi:protein TonB